MHVSGSGPESVRFRVVVTGAGADSRSRIERDDHASTIALTPLFNSVDLWQTSAVPARVEDDSTLEAAPTLEPPRGGVVVRFVTIPPDEHAHGSGASTSDALGAIGGTGSHVDGATVGLHRTDTVDVITVVAGELVAVLDDDETVLRAGDTLVQRGTTHAWSNRTAEPATFLATMYSADR